MDTCLFLSTACLGKSRVSTLRGDQPDSDLRSFLGSERSLKESETEERVENSGMEDFTESTGCGRVQGVL